MRLYGPGPTDPPPLISTNDLAGLRATDVEDRPVGALYGALSEERSGLIRYLDVELEGVARHVLVPIGHVRIDRESVQPRVRLRAATYEDLLSIPEYDPDETGVDDGYHADLLSAHGRLFYGAHYYAHPAFDHSGLYAGESPVIASDDGMDRPSAEAGARQTPAILPISEVRGRIARDKDLRGRPVEDHAGEQVGPVTDLLIEASTRRVRYAVIELERRPGRHAVLPIGYLQRNADETTTALATPDLSVEDIELVPPYEGPLTRADENRIHAALEARLVGDRYFRRPDFHHG